METTIELPIPVTLDGHETERIRFRKLKEEDLDELMPFFSSEEAMKFLPAVGPPRENGTEWIQRQIRRYNKNHDGLYALIHKTTGEIVGMCGLILQEVDNTPELEIGYHLLPKFWKQGFASEAAQYCKKFAKENKLAPSVISIVDLENFNSQKVAERNGMQRDKQTEFMGFPVHIYRAKL